MSGCFDSIRRSPLIEGKGSLLGQHGCSTGEDASVLAGRGIHVSGLDHINWGGDDGGAQARTKGGHQVAGQVICGEAGVQR